MKILLLQQKNKIAFFISFLVHAVLVACFFKFDVKTSEIKNDKALAVLFYAPSIPQNAIKEEIIEEIKEVKEEIIKEEIKEEKFALKPKKKHHKKPKPKQEVKEVKNSQDEPITPKNEPLVSEINEAKPTTTISNNTPAGGNNQDELISHIQSVLNKTAKSNYPMSSRKRREQGVVVVGFTYDYGKAKNIKILKPSKYENLNQAGIKSVEIAKFKRYERVLDISVPLKFSLH